MRISLFIALMAFVLNACVKRPSSSPVPTLDYATIQAWKTPAKIDTAVAVLGYEDGDGDIFLANSTQGPNIVGTFYYLNSKTNKFTAIKDPITNDTMRYTQTVIQPKEANYKGKSVKGELILPLSPFRSGDSVKTFKYTFFVQDEAGNKSNVITTPEIKISF